MNKRSMLAKSAVVDGRSTASAMLFTGPGETTSITCLLSTVIQLEIPGLSPVEHARWCLSRKVPVKRNKKSKTSSRQNVAIDPRQLQLAFIDADNPVRGKK